MNPLLLKDKFLRMVGEDQGPEDITSSFIPDCTVEATIIAKESCFVSGIEELTYLFRFFGIDSTAAVDDGNKVADRQEIFILSGNSRDILLVERTALNLLSRMSAITSHTRSFMALIEAEDLSVRLAATRKTSPLISYFEKKAVMVGGGDPHRWGLYDMVLIKDNHIKLFSSVADALEAAKKKTSIYHKIEIEVSNRKDAIDAARNGADIVMLDNMDVRQVQETLYALAREGLRDKVLVEVSGGINHDTILEYARCGPDVISVGGLTHSAGSRDFSLNLTI